MSSTLIILGLLAVGGWCFFMGPCQGWLSQLTSGGGSAAAGGNPFANFQPKSARAQELFSNPNFINDFITSAKQVEGKSEAEAQRIVEQNMSKYKAGYSRSYLGRYHDVISV